MPRGKKDYLLTYLYAVIEGNVTEAKGKADQPKLDSMEIMLSVKNWFGIKMKAAAVGILNIMQANPGKYPFASISDTLSSNLSNFRRCLKMSVSSWFCVA